jgi:hypothetical protein
VTTRSSAADLLALAERLESRAAHQPGLTDEERAEAMRRVANLRKVLARRAVNRRT